jgi:EAL domain-containing protein (putative c-di-GMP-specific phosphodiesterase class I)
MLSCQELSAQELSASIAAGEFEVFYQPRFSTDSMQVVALEALLRWEKCDNTQKVVSCLESAGLIKAATSAIIARVLQNTDRIRESIGFCPRMAINIPTLLLHDFEFFDRVIKSVDNAGVPHNMIEFEVTESSASTDLTSAIALSQSLLDIGFHIALDDFGMGFSGLFHLDMIPISTIKIDRHFINEIQHRNKRFSILKLIVGFSQAHNITCVAEGVETREQLSLVMDLGVHEVQGFLLAKPMHVDDVITFLRNYYFRKETLAQSRILLK